MLHHASDKEYKTEFAVLKENEGVEYENVPEPLLMFGVFNVGLVNVLLVSVIVFVDVKPETLKVAELNPVFA